MQKINKNPHQSGCSQGCWHHPAHTVVRFFSAKKPQKPQPQRRFVELKTIFVVLWKNFKPYQVMTQRFLQSYLWKNWKILNHKTILWKKPGAAHLAALLWPTGNKKNSFHTVVGRSSKKPLPQYQTMNIFLFLLSEFNVVFCAFVFRPFPRLRPAKRNVFSPWGE